MNYKKTTNKNWSQGKTFVLETHWNSCVAAASGGKWIKPSTQKDRGQLKMLADQTKEITKEVISFAVKNWGAFVEKAWIVKGLSTWPEEPNIGFLLKYCDVAVDMMQSIAQQNAPLAPKVVLPGVADKRILPEPAPDQLAQADVDTDLHSAVAKEDKEPSPIGAQNILDAKEHAPLLADIEHYAQVAGVQVKYIHQSMIGVCGDGEIQWVKHFRQNQKNGVPGLVLEGIKNPDVVCQSIAGALLRNYVDARMIPMNRLLEQLAAGTLPNPTVLLIPNLYIKLLEKGIPAWKMHSVYDLLLQRLLANKPSVVYLDSLEAIQNKYGVVFADFLRQFERVKG